MHRFRGITLTNRPPHAAPATLGRIFVLLMALSGVLPPQQADAFCTNRRYTVYNDRTTSLRINELRVSRDGRNWSQDLLGQKIEAGGSDYIIVSGDGPIYFNAIMPGRRSVLG